MICRPGCAVCCINISISSELPGMKDGKPAGIRCINLNEDNLCNIYNTELYPRVCSNFSPSVEMCGTTTEDARLYLETMEKLTK